MNTQNTSEQAYKKIRTQKQRNWVARVFDAREQAMKAGTYKRGPSFR